MSSSLLLALLVNRSPTERLIQNILNNPFAGIHQLAWFDWAMLIPYFTVLFILSIYGLHRYDIIRPTDFLARTIHYFTDPTVGVVQTRWSYLNRDYNFLTEVEGMLLDGHFILEHGARSCAGYFFNFNGTAGILRVSMIVDAGGWQHDTLTEDSDLSYRAQLKGWRFMYVPGAAFTSELP